MLWLLCYYLHYTPFSNLWCSPYFFQEYCCITFTKVLTLNFAGVRFEWWLNYTQKFLALIQLTWYGEVKSFPKEGEEYSKTKPQWAYNKENNNLHWHFWLLLCSFSLSEYFVSSTSSVIWEEGLLSIYSELSFTFAHIFLYLRVDKKNWKWGKCTTKELLI